MTWQVIVFVAYRVATALPTLRWPLAGALVALVGDFCDLFLMDAIGGIADYQRLDKLCDLAYLAVFLLVSLRWTGLERGVAVALFAYRIIGDAHQCRIVLLGRDRAPRLDLDHLPAAIRAAVRTLLVRRLRAAALRARHEVCRAQR